MPALLSGRTSCYPVSPCPPSTHTNPPPSLPYQTGSGKTCGYLLPSLANYLSAQAAGGNKPAPGGKPKGAPAILVMSPTRELAVQIHQQVWISVGERVG